MTYLLERGFTPEAIETVGWRVEPIGARARRYGLPAEASAALGWFIPYWHRNGRIRFERLRLIDEADLERYGGGKYRQPAGVPLRLYDPFGELTQEPLEHLLLVEGEANAVAVHMVYPELPVVGIAGQASLKAELAEELGHVPAVALWIDRHDPGAERNAKRIATRLRKAGVGEIRLLPSTAGMDANDALRELGPEKTREVVYGLLQQATPLDEDEAEDWPEIPRSTLAPFPLDALPRRAAAFAEAIAGATETPADLAGMTVLGVLSLAGLGTTVACGPTWDEEVTLYVLVAMESGDRKSSVLGAIAKPLHQLEREAREMAASEVRESRLRKDTLEARRTKLVKQASGTSDESDRDEITSELAEIETELERIGEPILPRLLADDATPETLGGLLAKFGPLGVISAEAPLISNVLGRYDSAGAANLDLMCKAYEGERTQVDRRNREELLERPLLTVVLTVQPHVLRKLIEHETARQQGLVGRFAFSVPESFLGRRRHHDAEVPGDVREGWDTLVRNVHSRKLLTEPTQTISVSSVSTREIGDFKLSLSPPARKLLHALRVEQEPRLLEDGDLRPHAAWIARHPGRVARIAGILHLADQDGQTISEETMRRALRIGDYLLAHGLAALTAPDEQCRRAQRWLERHDEPTVTERELHRGPLNSRGPAERARELAERLVELGALRPLAQRDDGDKRGRPPSPSYAVNPRLRGGPR